MGILNFILSLFFCALVIFVGYESPITLLVFTILYMLSAYNAVYAKYYLQRGIVFPEKKFTKFDEWCAKLHFNVTFYFDRMLQAL